jgi:tetratricopeptide (TPR) repeat protein
LCRIRGLSPASLPFAISRMRHLQTPLNLAGTVFAMLLLVACATSPGPVAVPEQPPSAAEAGAAPEPEPSYRPIPEDALYALLVAEFAARRGAVDLALEQYMEQARSTRDPGVAAQAARIARYMNAERAVLEAALLWAELDPASPEARYNAATELSRAGRSQEAFQQMVELQRLTGKANFAAIAAGALEAPEAERRAMLATLESLQVNDITDARVASALLLQSLGDNEEALALTAGILEEDPQNFQAILIEAQIYQNLGDTRRAYARIEKALEQEPDNTRLRLQYARLLAKTDLARSEDQFGILVTANPEDGELRLSLALVYREAKHYPQMRTQLEALLAAGQQPSAAHFYLGEDDERAGRTEDAIAHYLAVRPSPLFAMALTRAGELLLSARGPQAMSAALAGLRTELPEQALRILLLESELLVEHGDLDGAWALLSAALEQTPGETALLYARSMVSEKRRDVASLERDLREMLRLQPDSALALNALGYSLTNLTDRHQEALTLIRRALALQPDDPAILDSMGWVHYRLGDHATALGYLRDAYGRFPDHEVAAHLGEVLWVSGQQAEAREIWQKGLADRPDSRIIDEAMRRLGATPPGN